MAVRLIEEYMPSKIGINAVTGLLTAVGVLAFSAGLGYVNVRTIEDNEARVTHTHDVLTSLHLVMSTVKDAETGQRGFIIAGDPIYLKPYDAARAAIATQLDQLQSLVADNPEQADRVRKLRETVDLRLKSLAAGVTTQETAGYEAARAHVRRGLGLEQMEAIRERVDEMVRIEEDLLRERTQVALRAYRTAYFTTALATIVGVVLVGTVFYLVRRQVIAQQRMTEILERQVRERTLELNETNESLRVSNRELEQFASVASHDLQEPLRKIEAFGDRLKSRNLAQLDESGRDYLERVLLSATRMRSLINDLLNFSRVTTRAQPPQLLDLGSVAQDVVSDLEGRIQQTGGKVEIGTLPELEADPIQMRQLLQNLIGNALKFHRPGVPPVVRLASQAATNGKAATSCEITVEDNGIGFEEVYLDRIFNVFQRLHGRNEYEGTGMGLAICRKIVERHGGTITAQSKLEQGSRFIVTLPLRQPKKD